MEHAALHKLFTQIVDSSQVFKRRYLMKQQNFTNKMEKLSYRDIQ